MKDCHKSRENKSTLDLAVYYLHFLPIISKWYQIFTPLLIKNHLVLLLTPQQSAMLIIVKGKAGLRNSNRQWRQRLMSLIIGLANSIFYFVTFLNLWQIITKLRVRFKIASIIWNSRSLHVLDKRELIPIEQVYSILN